MLHGNTTNLDCKREKERKEGREGRREDGREGGKKKGRKEGKLLLQNKPKRNIQKAFCKESHSLPIFQQELACQFSEILKCK